MPSTSVGTSPSCSQAAIDADHGDGQRAEPGGAGRERAQRVQPQDPGHRVGEDHGVGEAPDEARRPFGPAAVGEHGDEDQRHARRWSSARW